MIEYLKIIGTIVVAAITTFGGGWLALHKFYIERQDKKDEELLQKRINDAVNKAKEDMRQEIKEAVQQGIVDCGVIGDRAIQKVQEDFLQKLNEGLNARGEEGKIRFEKNSKQIETNGKQIEELAGIIKEQTEVNNQKFNALAESLTSLNKIISISAESQCNSNYDRLLIVTNKVLKGGKMTISDKTNLEQLYGSWKDLGGKDAKMDTMFKECMKIPPILDEG